MKWFKLWNLISNKMVISKDVVIDEKFMLKQLVAINVSAYEGVNFDQ
jgi:hypothetical protein